MIIEFSSPLKHLGSIL